MATDAIRGFDYDLKQRRAVRWIVVTPLMGGVMTTQISSVAIDSDGSDFAGSLRELLVDVDATADCEVASTQVVVTVQTETSVYVLMRSPLRPAIGPSLTPREAEVVRLIADGLQTRAIGASLGISHNTVESYVRRIYVKLDVSSRAALVTAAVQHGLLRVEYLLTGVSDD